jgi:hypothetical protein
LNLLARNAKEKQKSEKRKELLNENEKEPKENEKESKENVLKEKGLNEKEPKENEKELKENVVKEKELKEKENVWQENNTSKGKDNGENQTNNENSTWLGYQFLMTLRNVKSIFKFWKLLLIVKSKN